MITNNDFNSTPTKKQRGAAVIVGVTIISLLLLGAAAFGFLTLNNSPGPVITADPVTIKADDRLTGGNSNNELSIDTKIIQAGVVRDEEQRKAAEKVLADIVLPVGDGVNVSTTVEAARLSQLQTEFIAEADRRLELLNENTVVANKLKIEQRPAVLKLLGDETTALTGLKAKAAAETTTEAFLTDRAELDKEYGTFILAVAQVRLLFWANDQTVLNEKINVLGGKFQERLNDASSNGSSIARAQTALNTYQTSKSLGRDATAKAMAAVMAVKAGSYEANRAVLKSYYSQLATGHSEADKASKSAQELVLEVRTFKP